MLVTIACTRLGLGREVARDIELADGIAERAVGGVDPALPARALLRRAVSTVP